MRKFIIVYFLASVCLQANPIYNEFDIEQEYRNNYHNKNRTITENPKLRFLPDDINTNPDSSIRFTPNYIWVANKKSIYENDLFGNIITDTEYLLVDGKWEAENKTLYEYDNNNLETQHINYMMQSGEWVPINKYINYYNDDDLPDSIIIQNNVGGKWYNSYKTEYQYDNLLNKTASIFFEFVSGNWKERTKTEFTYSNNLVTKEDYYDFIGDWYQTGYCEHNYKANKLLASTVFYHKENNEWTDYQKYEYTYDSHDKKQYLTLYIMTIAYFQPFQRWHYYYDDNSFNDSTVSEILKFDRWSFKSKYEYEYNEHGAIQSNYYSYYQSSGLWSKQNYSLYEYNSNNMLEKLSNYIIESDTLRLTTMYEYKYNNSNNLLMEEVHYFNSNSMLVPSIKYNFKYNESKLLSEKKSWTWKIEGLDSIWVLNYIDDFIYDEHDNVVEEISRKYNKQKNDTSLTYKYAMSYVGKMEVERLFYTYKLIAPDTYGWVLYEKIRNNYNNNDSLIEIINYVLVDEVWKEEYKFAYDYNEQKLLQSEVFSYWLYNWRDDSKTIYFYSNPDAVESTPDTPTASLECAPNPCSDFSRIEINLPVDANFELSIVDLKGKLLRKIADGRLAAGARTFNLDTKFLSSGTYLVSLKTNNKIITKKIQIIK